MPRIETTLTLARSLGPALPPPPADHARRGARPLAARRLLRLAAGSHRLGSARSEGFEHAVDAVVQAAHALVRAVAAVPPPRATRTGAPAGNCSAVAVRAAPNACWRRSRSNGRPQLPRRSQMRCTPYARPPGSCCRRWCRPARAAADAVVDAAVPCLLLDADVPLDDPFAPLAALADVAVGVCTDVEDEAQRTAAQVIARRSPPAMVRSR
jgi:hypothetical protein